MMELGHLTVPMAPDPSARSRFALVLLRGLRGFLNYVEVQDCHIIFKIRKESISEIKRSMIPSTSLELLMFSDLLFSAQSLLFMDLDTRRGTHECLALGIYDELTSYEPTSHQHTRPQPSQQ